MRSLLISLLAAVIVFSCRSKSDTAKLPDLPKIFSVGDGRIVKTVDFSPDGKTLIAGGENKKIKLINRETGEIIWTSPEQPDAVLAAAIAPNGKVFVTTCGDNEKNTGQVVVCAMDSKTERWSRKGLLNDVQLAKFSRNGANLIVANYYNITLFEAETGKQLKFFSGHAPDVAAPYGHVDAVTEICFTKDSSKFISVGWDKNVKVWDVTAGHETKTFPESERINACILNPDESKIITGSSDALHVWNRTTDRIDTIVAYNGEITSMCAVQNYFVTGDEAGTIAIWDVNRYTKINEIRKAHLLGVWCLNPSPDGKYFVSSGGDGKVTVWNVDYLLTFQSVADSTKGGN